MPVYAGRVPALAVERLKGIKTSGVKCVIVAVYGNRAYEDALVEMQDVAVGELLLKRHTNPLSQINKEIRLEAYTEQSESNPGRSLGIINKEGTAVWKTVPTRAGFTCSSLRDDHKCSKSITDNALMSLATKIMF